MGGIRFATPADLPTLARIHKAAYSKEHFTTLLPDGVLESYYGRFLGGGSEILVATGDADGAAARDAAIEGFAVFGVGIPERIASFKRQFFATVALTSLRHPVAAARKLVSRLFARFAGGCSRPRAECLLLSIAAAVPRKGIGKRLLEAAAVRAETSGSKVMGLYVNQDNVGAINAYFGSGFSIVCSRAGQFYMERALRR